MWLVTVCMMFQVGTAPECFAARDSSSIVVPYKADTFAWEHTSEGFEFLDEAAPAAPSIPPMLARR